MRRLLVLALLGCASGGGSTTPASSPAGDPNRVVLVDDRGRVYRTPADRAPGDEQIVPATRQQAVQALVGAYEALGLSVNTLDWTNGRVGVRAFTAPRRLGGTQLGKFFDCGINHLGEQRANSYAMRLDVESVVTQQSTDRVLMSTRAGATAKQLSVSSDPLNCSSSGHLEKRLHMLAAERLATK
jgi:hypothetical protein